MSATVATTNQKMYSDSSGYFYEGLKREDVKDFKGLYGIFGDSKKEFDRIDSDGDGVLSKGEIDEELLCDIDNNSTATSTFAGLGLVNTLLSYSIRKISPKWSFLGLGSAILCAGMALYDNIKVDKLEKRLAAGVN